jgi:hypothetical protein
MSGKMLRFSVVVVFLLMFSAVAYADVTGTWGITGTAKQKISLKGRSSKQEFAISDQFIFGPGTAFTMYDLPPEANGTWGYVKKKFAVYLDNNYLASSITETLISGFADEGYTVEIYNPAITKNSFTGKEMKDGTIKGKWNLVYAAYLYLVGYNVGANMKYKSTITFAGIRGSGADVLEFDPDQTEDFTGETFQGIIGEAVSNGIQETLKAIEPAH